MKNIKIIPHFHGISFCNDNYNNLNIEQINQNRERIFNLYKNGNAPYYSEMIFKNAFLDPNKELSEYDIRLMEDFYVGEVENVFNNRNIMTQEEFLEFSRHYVNNYKSCASSATFNGQSKEHFRNPYKQLEESLNSKYNEKQNYENYTLKSIETYSPKVKEKIKNIKLIRDECCAAILDIKGKKNKTNERKNIKDNFQFLSNKENENMEDNAYDPFIATSKFPFHPIKFAISNNKKDEFKKQFKLFKDVNAQYLLLGMVFCDFYSEEEYNQELKHDIPQIKHLKDIKYSCRYLYQTEVDFYKINPQNFKFAFPILLIKNNISENDKQDIKEKFGLNENEYSTILECSPYDKRCKKQRTYVSSGTIFDNICKNYSKLILRKAKNLLNENEKLYYLNPINEFVKIEDENRLNDYTNNVHTLSITNSGNGVIVDQQLKKILGIEDLKDRFVTVKNDIFNIIKEKEDLEEATKLLSEKVSEEKYETVCASRIVSKLTNGRNTVEENDAKIAQILQKREDRRYRDMVKNKQVNLGEFFESIGI